VTTWGTMGNEILSNTGRPSGDREKVNRCIVDAIDAHRGDGFFFNETTFTVATVDGQSGYGEATSGFPKGLVEFIGDPWLEVAQDSTILYRLQRAPWPTLLQLRESSPGKSQPTYWSWWNKLLELWPTPDATVHNLRASCYAAPGTPVKKFNTTTSVFDFFQPDGVTAMADSYPASPTVNAWFAEGYQMIRCYAEYLFYSQVIHAQNGRAEAALTAYLQSRGALEQRAARLSTPRFIEPMALDGY
jgi:hypothetical protein